MKNEQLIARLVAALERMVNCPDVNLDELSPETLKALDKANEALAEAKSVKA